MPIIQKLKNSFERWKMRRKQLSFVNEKDPFFLHFYRKAIDVFVFRLILIRFSNAFDLTFQILLILD